MTSRLQSILKQYQRNESINRGEYAALKQSKQKILFCNNGSREEYSLRDCSRMYNNLFNKYDFCLKIYLIEPDNYLFIDSQTCSYMWDPIFESNSINLPIMCSGR